jgi:hypothetical protein
VFFDSHGSTLLERCELQSWAPHLRTEAKGAVNIATKTFGTRHKTPGKMQEAGDGGQRRPEAGMIAVADDLRGIGEFAGAFYFYFGKFKIIYKYLQINYLQLHYSRVFQLVNGEKR